MPSKILGKGGDSLADMYDVAGSIAGVEELDSESVKVVHEMGATIFSERLSGTIRRISTGDINQSTVFDLTLTDLPGTPNRILGVQVIADVSGRASNAMVAVRDPVAGREFPVWVWDVTDDLEQDIRIVDNGAAVADMELLVPRSLQTPSFLIGNNQPQGVPDIAFRGQSGAFGAGTVEIIALIYITFSQVGGLSSRGLPVPSW